MDEITLEYYKRVIKEFPDLKDTTPDDIKEVYQKIEDIKTDEQYRKGEL
jgi:hypothetical protein